MNHRLVYLLSICLCMLLLLTGCQSENGSLIPITGAQGASIPALVEQTRNNVLDYVTSTSRFAGIPSSVDWQLDGAEPIAGEYHFRSGDWRMVLRLANSMEENGQVAIINQTENAYWCGYVKPDGQVVDTSFIR